MQVPYTINKIFKLKLKLLLGIWMNPNYWMPLGRKCIQLLKV